MAWKPLRIFSKKNKEATKGQTITDKKTQTKTNNVIKEFKGLSEKAAILEIVYESDEKSIGALKEQVDKVETAGKELNRSLTELSSLPSNIAKLPQEQASLREEIDQLKQENRKLFLQYSKGKISLETPILD